MYVITQIVEINTQVLLGDYLRLLKYHKYTTIATTIATTILTFSWRNSIQS